MTNRRPFVLPVNDERKQVFLEELARTGSETAAARAASPHSIGNNGGLSSFVWVRDRDPEFAAAWIEAKERALGEVEREIHRRAMTPSRRPVYHRGKKVDTAEERTTSDKMLLRVAEKLDPSWAPRSRVEANVSVTGALLSIRPEDILHLDERDREEFIRLLGAIADAKGEDDGDISTVLDPDADSSSP